MAPCWGQELSVPQPCSPLGLPTGIWLVIFQAHLTCYSSFSTQLDDLQDGSSVPRALFSACYKASEWKFLLRLCGITFFHCLKGIFLTSGLAYLKGFGGFLLFLRGLFCFCFLFVFILAFLLFIFPCRPDI